MVEDMERVFSEAGANALLPTIITLLGRLRDAHRKLLAVGRSAGRRAASNGSPSLGAAAGESELAYAEVVSEIEALGVIVRDPESGLVDFAAVRGDQQICLCWRLGEDRLGFWHPRDSGFAGRRPLE